MSKLRQKSARSSLSVEQVLRPDKDKAFLIHFDREVELLQDLTSSFGFVKVNISPQPSTDKIR